MTTFKDKTFVLAGDIGGTKTNLGLFTQGKRRPLSKVIETFSSQNAPDLEHIIRQFLEIHTASVTHACFGVAGPVVDGKSKTTNLPWNISEDRIKKQFNFHRVKLVNDLTATAMAIPLLKKDEFFPLNQAGSIKDRNLALIAPGTGLGKAMLIYQNGRYLPVPSEGGHADFAPNNEAEMKLWRYLHQHYGHVSIERVVSGSGLVNIYNWLKDSGRLNKPDWLRQKLKEMDPAKSITEAALANKDVGCVKALNMFVSIFGAVAGNLALTGMTTGGVYLGGGIPPKILSKLKENIFMEAFINKGRFKGFLEKIPVKVILNDKAALIGAAYCATMLK
ncbi:MAG: glucokinase [Thermodesulfobacteriota bacterium]|nr:glucokinase [Thermodesulfobacteriota bacterium]